jgi:hypothetical protein
VADVAKGQTVRGGWEGKWLTWPKGKPCVGFGRGSECAPNVAVRICPRMPNASNIVTSGRAPRALPRAVPTEAAPHACDGCAGQATTGIRTAPCALRSDMAAVVATPICSHTEWVLHPVGRRTADAAVNPTRPTPTQPQAPVAPPRARCAHAVARASMLLHNLGNPSSLTRIPS